MMIAPVDDGKGNIIPTPRILSAWPQVNENQWCGEHTVRIALVPGG